VAVGHRHPDRLEAPHQEAGERARERDVAGQGQARGHSDHARLRAAQVERALRILLGEGAGHRRLREVGVERDDPLVGRPQLDERFPERGAGGLGRHHFFPMAESSATIGAAQAGTGSPTISRIARTASSGFGALPCHSGSFSMNETPLPLTVWATMKVGAPLLASAWSRALSTWAMSCPLTSSTGQPNALSLSVIGSRSRIFFTKPSSWMPL